MQNVLQSILSTNDSDETTSDDNKFIMTNANIFMGYGDPRVYDWPLMKNPLPIFAILGLYLMIIYKWGPRYMQNRQPFEIKGILAVYNLSQVMACLYLVYNVISNDTNLLQVWKCHNVDFRPNVPKAMRTLTLTYITFFVKLFELIETVFFVMRKKQSQVTKLHVYHHCSTLILAWIMVKFAGGGMILISLVLNAIIHVIMYSYYFIALFGEQIQQKIRNFKKAITIMQMIQFSFILAHCTLTVVRGCDVPITLVAMFVPNVLINFYMFYKFFTTAYLKKNNDNKLKMK